ncbi:glycosyltransferase family 4 protein [uncultured Sphingomonas sp.]|uniref:glycosyltransferase family 4 protein n=1 Tax=uncultured Sphingomonas sp. TaxID=158754 RepID=UPI0025F521B6|nr:glycosyltransferase family 4 protein [uncultured Sphingomonas sp.]
MTAATAGRATGTAGPDARLRILHVITHLDMGGAENVAMTLVERLHARAASMLFAVLDPSPRSAVGQAMTAQAARLDVPIRTGVAGRFKSGGVLIAARSLARAVRAFRPDAIHVHTEIPELTLAIACLLSARVRRTPLLRTVHNSTLWIDWGPIGAIVTRILSHGHAVAVSRTAAEADARIATGRTRPWPTVIHNGVTAPPRATPRAPGAPFALLFAGRLVHQKGADLLPAILSVARAQSARRDVTVTIAGSGALRAAVAADLRARDWDGWTVSLTDPIAGLAERLGEQDAVLLPSRFEGFALLPLEVLMAGVPLVTTTAPGLTEAIPEDYPFQAAPDDVEALGRLVARVIDDPAAARALAADHGARLAERFDVAAMADAYWAQYRALSA